jgi:hypothetical protein
MHSAGVDDACLTGGDCEQGAGRDTLQFIVHL